jgi:hypothetical protein
MTAIFQRWAPTKAEAELLVDMLTARLAPAKIAAFLFIDVRKRVLGAAGRGGGRASCPEPPPFRPPAPKGPPTSRVVAERLFYREDQ